VQRLRTSKDTPAEQPALTGRRTPRRTASTSPSGREPWSRDPPRACCSVSSG